MNVKIIAIIMAALVCGGAVAYYAVIDHGDDGAITIIDGSGKKITLNEPLTDVVAITANAAKAMKVLGLTEEVKGLSFYASPAREQEDWERYSKLFQNAVRLAEAKVLTGENVRDEAQCQYVIAPVGTQGVNAQQEIQFKGAGVTVIRLDFFGDSALDDLEKLTILFGQDKNPDMMAAYDSYLEMYNDVVNTVKAAVEDHGKVNETFLYYFGTAAGGGTFYNQTSAGSKMIELIYGKNALRNVLTSQNLKSLTNPSGEDGIKQVVIKEDRDNGIDKIFIRGNTSTDPGLGTAQVKGVLTIWNESNLPGYGLSAVAVNEVYVFNTNIMSGMLSFAGWVAIAQVCDIPTGLNIADLVTAYNTKYGFDDPTYGFIFKMTGGDTGNIGFERII
jgi:ABC-type Fe3+-hydroxamate transport system substrate-binding protein